MHPFWSYVLDQLPAILAAVFGFAGVLLGVLIYRKPPSQLVFEFYSVKVVEQPRTVEIIWRVAVVTSAQSYAMLGPACFLSPQRRWAFRRPQTQMRLVEASDMLGRTLTKVLRFKGEIPERFGDRIVATASVSLVDGTKGRASESFELAGANDDEQTSPQATG